MSQILRASRLLCGGDRLLGTTPFGLLSRQSAAYASARVFIVWSIIALVGSSCGKVGAPVPPTRLTERTSNLAAIQRGTAILLTWPVPTLVLAESSRFYVSRVEIYRLVERRDQEPILDPFDYEETAQVIGFLERATIEAQARDLGHLQFADSINLNNPAELPNTRLRYAVRYVNKRGHAAAFSNTVVIEPVPGIAMPPAGLRITDEAQDSITISWSPPAANVDGATPAAVVGYNVYRRRAKREAGGGVLNSEPITDTTFIDRAFQYQSDYVYIVRALSQGTNGLIESADSEPLSFTPVDRFAPSTPDPVSAASANGTVSLFWPSSPEADLVGYNVYRAGSTDLPHKDWIMLNDQPIKAVTFRDERVVIDQTYFYRVTAVDRFNNESARSRVVSETAHP